MRVKVISGEYNVGKEAEVIGWDFSGKINYFNLSFQQANGNCEFDDGYAEHQLEFLNEDEIDTFKKYIIR